MVKQKKDEKRKQPLKGVLVGGQYCIEKRVGGGAFGEVYQGKDLVTGIAVAFKMEITKDKKYSHLNFEYKIYQSLNRPSITVGIPKVYYYGSAGDYMVLVMDLLGPSLEELFLLCNRHFSIKTVCMLGIQLIERIQYFHATGFLHRDIKPENFLMGVGKSSHILYLIDVGLAKVWRSSEGYHISYKENQGLTGTARYVSINTHRGIQQSRRDDLESIGYLLMYFLHGSLPWQGLKIPKNDKMYAAIRDAKIKNKPEVLAKGFPTQFVQLLSYIRELKFEENPDYKYCVNLLAEIIVEKKESQDYQFEWCGLKAVPKIIEGPCHSEEVEPSFKADREFFSGHATAFSTAGSTKVPSTIHGVTSYMSYSKNLMTF